MITLEEHIKEVEPGLKKIIMDIAEKSKIIRTGFPTKRGKAGSENVYGEEQAEMDKWADELLVDNLKEIDSVASISSEERPDLIEADPNGRYSVMMDPLDGSSLLDIDLTVGTIIGIHKGKDPYRKGTDLACAMYVLYGPMNYLVYTVGEGVHSFILGKTEEYLLLEENMEIPEGKIYSPGGKRGDWTEKHRRYIRELEGNGYKLRYSGCFAADAHQILHKGGVFTYPALEDKPEGKLRLLFEAVPMGYLVQQAGGRVSNGEEDILEIVPHRLDIRVPIYIGGKKEIEMIEEMD
ncbi:MAG: class 1 fructose-bisphosphatase [Thermoplasmatota archaeon]